MCFRSAKVPVIKLQALLHGYDVIVDISFTERCLDISSSLPPHPPPNTSEPLKFHSGAAAAQLIKR